MYQSSVMKRCRACLLVLLICRACPGAASTGTGELNQEPKTIRLGFRPVPVVPLSLAHAAAGWRRAKRTELEGAPGHGKAAIQLYVNAHSEMVAETHALLEDSKGCYDLGTVSCFGGAEVRKIHRPGANTQWEISGTMGAACDCLVIIAFHRSSGRWVQLLREEANNTEQVDLEGDGQKEILGYLGVGADVIIYRWNRDHFESVDIAHALGCDRADILQRGQDWLVKSESTVGAKPRVRYFRYAKDMLAWATTFSSSTFTRQPGVRSPPSPNGRACPTGRLVPGAVSRQ